MQQEPRRAPESGPEAEFRERILARIRPHFEIELEVPGRFCNGRRMYLDAVIRPKAPWEWKNPKVAMGLEFKRVDVSDALGNITGAIAQAEDYAHATWDRYGRIYVFLCPGYQLGIRQTYRMSASRLDALLEYVSHSTAQRGVGELMEVTPYHGLALVHSGTHVLWSEKQGIMDGARHHMDRSRKDGSR